MEEPLAFVNKNGKKLSGIVHVPENSSPDGRRVGINFLNPGIKYRVAPHRLSVKIARALCENGYYVLRFDPEGIGDSEGEIDEGAPIGDVWGRIQSGLFVADTITATDFFIKNYRLDRVLVGGNCGGAITALIAGAKDNRVGGLCLIDVPIYLWNASRSFAEVATEGSKKADWLFAEYVRRVFKPESWYRLVTLQTDYKALLRVLEGRFRKMLRLSGNKEEMPVSLERLCCEKKLNPLFFKSFDAVALKNKPVLFVLAGNDPGIETFQNYFENGYLKYREKGCGDSIEIFRVENANHIYTLSEWQETLREKVVSWIDKAAQVSKIVLNKEKI